MGELLSEFGDLVFSLVIGYIGAIEFLYVVRHLYHWSFNHDAAEYDNDDERVAHLQDTMRNQLAKASDKENKAGAKVMQDGIQYKDGFRIDPLQDEIDKLKEKLKDKELQDLQRQELEKELSKLQKIAEQTRKDLEKAEAAKRTEEEENARKLKEAEEKREREQRKREEEQQRKEAEENARKLVEKEKQRELEQRRLEEEQQQKELEENNRKLVEQERQRELEQRKLEEEQQRKEIEENNRKLAEQEKQRELEQRKLEEKQQQKELEENQRKVAEKEKQRELEQRRLEEEQQQKELEENNRQLVEQEKQRELEQKRKEEEKELKQKQEEEEEEELQQQQENERQLLEAERLKEEEQRHLEEEEENERKYLELEHKLEEQLRAAEQEADLTEKEKQLIESIKNREIAAEEHNEQKEAELLRRILEAREQLGEESEEEQSLRLIQREQDQEAKQRRIEENALLFLEAEKEMAEIQQQLQVAVEKRVFASNLDSAPQTPIAEEPCIKKTIAPLLEQDSTAPAISHRVKTQLAQDFNESHSVSTKSLLFPGVSDEGSSVEPTSSQQSSFSTQPSEEVTTGTDSQYPPRQGRQEPDGEDTTPSQQYSEDYLRSLDGIKQRPLIREDGSGRRRAFKKRRSSNSSNSSRESRTSRDEELKMFTSLEEEEMKTTGDSEFTPIRYTSEPTLKVKGHHRRHKRSPAKDMKSDESLRSSLERLGEESSDPWGEVKPEPYKNTEFWKREKALSINEEMEFEKPASSEEISYDTATNMPSASSFEEATQIQNEQAITALRQQASKEQMEEDVEDSATLKDDSAKSDHKANLQTSQRTEQKVSPARSSASPSLRRSPRIEEMNQYEERLKESHEETANATNTSPEKSPNTPSITVQSPLDFGTWRDERGLMMEGLSDFYDFTASINPSRSRNNSRNPSPANTAPSTPLPKDVSFDLELPNSEQSLANAVEIYDDTEALDKNEFKKENIIKFIDSLNGIESASEEVEYELSTNLSESSLQQEIKYVMDDLSKRIAGESSNKISLVPMVNIIDDSSLTQTFDNGTQDDMNSLVATLRTQRREGSRSRSKSPLPTPGNIERSLESRRNKMIKHNKDVLEKLIETNLLPDSPPTPEEKEEISKESINSLVDSLRTHRSSSHLSRSRSRSPLPTPSNIERSLEHRRNKRIQENDELFEKLNLTDSSRSQSPVILNDSYEDKEDIDLPKEEEHSDHYNDSKEHMDYLVQSLRVAQSRSRSKSPMRLPTADNLNKSIDSRRHKLIERNDEYQKQLDKRSNTPESPNLTVDYVYEFEESSSEVSEHVQQTTSQVPTISIEFDEHIETSFTKDDDNDDCSREQMDLLVQSLRVARSRSRTPIHRRSRSKSPMRFSSDKNRQQSDSAGATMEYDAEFQQSQEITTQSSVILNTPTIFIQSDESDHLSSFKVEEDPDDCSREKMDSLVQSLRVARSRSRSKSPMRLPTADNLNKSLDSRRHKLIEQNDELQQHLEERAKTPEPPSLSVEYVYEFENSEQSDSSIRSRNSRSKSPSRSHSHSPRHESSRSETPSRSLSPNNEAASEYNDFHVMLNLEGSQNKTLSKNSEELESLKLQRQRRVDEEALEKLKNASEEIELRTLSPLVLDHDELNEQQSQDYLAELPITERSKILRKSPTTPDYERTISEEMRDVERIKQDMIEKGFKRSTYVGESLDMGSEYEPLRREAAHFQRSHSPSPSFSRTELETSKLKAEEKRKIQDLILTELTGSNSNQDSNQMRHTGAIPKTEKLTSTESELSLSNEIQDTLRIQENMLSSGFQRSTYEGESVDISVKYEEMRRRNAEFRRSASKSRSPLKEAQIEELAEIEKEAAKKELQDKVLDEIAINNINFQEFSKHLNPEFFENDRRASDSALMQKPEILVQFQDNNYDSMMDMEPEEYHHFRRFSLAQEQQMEEYPSDDYIYIEKVEVRTRSGSRTWTRADYYSEDVNDFLIKQEDNNKKSTEDEEEHAKSSSDTEVKQEPDILLSDHDSDDNVVEDNPPDNIIEDDEDYSNNSDDDRQTVVEVDDEIDEDISDFKAEESHHDTSECEEADREIDRYAGRNASDWQQVANVEDGTEGAVGGSTQSPYDSDSFAIDQIYDEAVKNRKQSGILREYDSILMQMSKNDIDEQYALWSKSQGKKKPRNIEFNVSFVDNERKDTEIRYLGDAKVTERKSVRLRSRYGYNPVLQSNHLEDDLEVDLNYKPKREYNWRKNFKLDEDNAEEERNERALDGMKYNPNEDQEDEHHMEWEEENGLEEPTNIIDIRKYSLGGESVTLFSRSPERSIMDEDYADNADNEEVIPAVQTINDNQQDNYLKEEKLEKPKKKKTKKKSHKESKGSLEFIHRDEDDIPDSYIYSRRSSSIQMETDSPKRKSRSRRSSKSSLTNDDASTLFSPRSSVGYAEPIADIIEEYTEMTQETVRPKKIKKRKKVKETMKNVTESPLEQKEEFVFEEPLTNLQPISAIITPESSCDNILSTLSPQNSVCVTPASIDSEINGNLVEEKENSGNSSISASTTTSPVTNTSRTGSITTPVDTFDILKDANFYPLF